MTLQLSLIIETPTNKAETEKILAGYSFMERMGVTMLEGMITPMDKEDTKQVRPPSVRPSVQCHHTWAHRVKFRLTPGSVCLTVLTGHWQSSRGTPSLAE